MCVRMRWAAATLLLTCLTVRVLTQENSLPRAAQPPSPRERVEIIEKAREIARDYTATMRLTHAAEGIPAEWPASALFGEFDYGLVRIDGKQFLLPLHAETRVNLKAGVQHRTVVEFNDYHQFSTGVTITPVN
jgi:hypothetical protein